MASKLYVYMMRSRNKDNKNVDGFKERVKTFLEYEDNEEKILKKFDDFVEKGVTGEKSRLYKSVNSRDIDKIRKDLIVRLLKNDPEVTTGSIDRILASVAQQTENRAESKWLFDFDENNEFADLFVNEFRADVSLHSGIDFSDIEVHKTPNGYAVIVPHGFDTRQLFIDWGEYDITLKRDELLFLDMKEKII